jgi:prolyl oligopeptidase
MPLGVLKPVEEILHGVVVRDPYRWLEDRTLPETQDWIEEQQRRCDSYFASCGDLASIGKRVQDYLDTGVVDQPARVGDRYFYRCRDRGQEQACIYVRDITTGAERLLVDPSNGGPFASVGIYRISEDGSLLAYEAKQGGEDRRAIRFVDVESGRTLADRIETGYARGLAFTPDHRGFLYCHELSGDVQEHRIQLHRFHESVADHVVFRGARTPGSRLVLTADSVHLGAILVHRHGPELIEDLWIARRNEPTDWRQVFAGRMLPFSPILRYGRIFALSYADAPKGRLVELSEDGREIRVIIPERNTMIRRLVVASSRIYTSHLDNLVPSVRKWSLSGEDLGEIDLPPDGTVQLIANRDEGDGFFYTYESFTQPTITFEYLSDSGQSLIWHSQALPANREPVQVRRVTYRSNDDTLIPMTLVGKNTGSTCEAPVILSAYGGFGVSATPQFSTLVTVLLELGAVFALPHIRGGGEFGRAWHEAARGKNRQASFDDLLMAAAWLRREGITSPRQLALFGGSNSGLLVGAAMTQRPDLFRAVLCIAPLLDMLRYEHFDKAAQWRHEYGSIGDPEEFKALHAYSPYHRMEDHINYPAVMFVTGDKDERCNPAHVRKMAARLEDRDSQTSPVIVDYSEERGHAPVLPLSIRIDALTRRIAFLCKELGLSTSAGGVP